MVFVNSAQTQCQIALGVVLEIHVQHVRLVSQLPQDVRFVILDILGARAQLVSLAII